MTQLSRPSDQPIGRPGTPGAFLSPINTGLPEALSRAGAQIGQGATRLGLTLASVEAAEKATARVRTLSDFHNQLRVADAEAGEAADLADPVNAGEAFNARYDKFEEEYVSQIDDPELQAEARSRFEAQRAVSMVGVRRSSRKRLAADATAKLSASLESLQVAATDAGSDQELEALIDQGVQQINDGVGVLMSEDQAQVAVSEMEQGLRRAFAEGRIPHLATAVADGLMTPEAASERARSLASAAGMPEDAVADQVMLSAARAASADGRINRAEEILKTVTLDPGVEGEILRKAQDANASLLYRDMSVRMTRDPQEQGPLVMAEAINALGVEPGEEGHLPPSMYNQLANQFRAVQDQAVKAITLETVGEMLGQGRGRWVQERLDRLGISRTEFNTVVEGQLAEIESFEEKVDYLNANGVTNPDWESALSRIASISDDEINQMRSGADPMGVADGIELMRRLKRSSPELANRHMSESTQRFLRDVEVSLFSSKNRGNLAAATRAAFEARTSFASVNPNKADLEQAASEALGDGMFFSGASNQLEMFDTVKALSDYYMRAGLEDSADEAIEQATADIQDTHVNLFNRMVYAGDSSVGQEQLEQFFGAARRAWVARNPDANITEDEISVRRRGDKWALVDTTRGVELPDRVSPIQLSRLNLPGGVRLDDIDTSSLNSNIRFSDADITNALGRVALQKSDIDARTAVATRQRDTEIRRKINEGEDVATVRDFLERRALTLEENTEFMQDVGAPALVWIGDAASSLFSGIKGAGKEVMESLRVAPEAVTSAITDVLDASPSEAVATAQGGINQREFVANAAAVIRDGSVKGQLFDESIPIAQRVEIAEKALREQRR